MLTNSSPHQKDITSEFYEQIGRLVVVWSNLEAVLNICIIFIHNRFPDCRPDKDLPNALKRKIAYLHRAANTIPELTELRRDIFSLSNGVRLHSDARHQIIHGLGSKASGWPYEHQDKLGFERLLLQNNKYCGAVTFFDVDDVRGQTLKATQLCEEALYLLERLKTEVSPNNFD